jgi:hypothetical protein
MQNSGATEIAVRASLPNDATTAALAIRLHRCASFQEKLHQLVGK